MKKRAILGPAIALTVLIPLGWRAVGDEDGAGKEAVRAFMRGKLDSSRDIMEGLVTENFDRIVLAADRLRLMSKKAEWNSIKTDRYVQHSLEFQRTTEQLAKAGREKNLDSAALAWTQVMLNCLNCHRDSRDAAMARLDELVLPLQTTLAVASEEAP